MIDWTKDVQMYLSSTGWEDVTILCQPIDGYVWLKHKNAVSPSTWSLAKTEFRNKPVEPKRVKGWLCLMKHNDAGTYHIGRFLHDTCESAREYINAEYPYASCVAVFEIDVTEGQGAKGIQWSDNYRSQRTTAAGHAGGRPSECWARTASAARSGFDIASRMLHRYTGSRAIATHKCEGGKQRNGWRTRFWHSQSAPLWNVCECTNCRQRCTY